jgi:hypothetical protein
MGDLLGGEAIAFCRRSRVEQAREKRQMLKVSLGGHRGSCAGNGSVFHRAEASQNMPTIPRMQGLAMPVRQTRALIH